MADDIVGHAFSHGFHPDHTERLAALLAQYPELDAEHMNVLRRGAINEKEFGRSNPATVLAMRLKAAISYSSTFGITFGMSPACRSRIEASR